MGNIDVRFYLSLVLRRLPVVLAIIATVSAAGVALAYLLPVVYQASARILVEAPEIPAELARTTVPISAQDQMQVIRQQIDTRDNLLDLAAQLKLYGSSDGHMTPDEIVDDMRARMVIERKELDASASNGTSVYNVTFEAKQPALAAEVVNKLVELILDRNMRARTDSAGATQTFFNQEVVRLSGELSKIEAEILAFKNANKEALPDSLDFRRTQQSSLQERMLMLEREESSLRNRRTNLVQMQESTGQVIGNGPVSLEQQMLQDLNKALSEQLAVFAEDSPTIVALHARIAALQANIRSKNDPNAVVGKKGISDLDFQLSDIDERLKFITAEKAAIVGTLASLTKSIGATANNTTILSAMERNQANTQSQYNMAVSRLAEASTGQQIEIRSKGGRLSLVEPAVAPTEPIRPKRKRIALLGVVAGLGLAAAYVLLLELTNKTIRRPADLDALFQTSPLATIPYIMADDERRKPLYKLFSTRAALFPLTIFAVRLWAPDPSGEPPSSVSTAGPADSVRSDTI